jgi:hypothetical protein
MFSRDDIWRTYLKQTHSYLVRQELEDYREKTHHEHAYMQRSGVQNQSKDDQPRQIAGIHFGVASCDKSAHQSNSCEE